MLKGGEGCKFQRSEKYILNISENVFFKKNVKSVHKEYKQ